MILVVILLSTCLVVESADEVLTNDVFITSGHSYLPTVAGNLNISTFDLVITGVADLTVTGGLYGTGHVTVDGNLTVSVNMWVDEITVSRGGTLTVDGTLHVCSVVTIAGTVRVGIDAVLKSEAPADFNFNENADVSVTGACLIAEYDDFDSDIEGLDGICGKKKHEADISTHNPDPSCAVEIPQEVTEAPTGDVGDDYNFDGDCYVNQTWQVNGDLNCTGRLLWDTDNGHAGKKLTVEGDCYIGMSAVIDGDFTVKGKLWIIGELTIDKTYTVNVTGATHVCAHENRLIHNGAIHIRETGKLIGWTNIFTNGIIDNEGMVFAKQNVYVEEHVRGLDGINVTGQIYAGDHLEIYDIREAFQGGMEFNPFEEEINPDHRCIFVKLPINPIQKLTEDCLACPQRSAWLQENNELINNHLGHLKNRPSQHSQCKLCMGKRWLLQERIYQLREELSHYKSPFSDSRVVKLENINEMLKEKLHDIQFATD